MTTAAYEPLAQPRATAAVRRKPLPHVLGIYALIPHQKFGSMEEQICVLAQHFQAEHSLFLPLFICDPGPQQTAQFEQRGVAAECLELDRFHWSRLWKLVGLIQQHHIRIVHWNFTAPIVNGYLWMLTLLTPWVQHFYTDHNSRYPPRAAPPGGLTRFAKWVLLRRYRQVVGVSRFVVDCLREQRCWSHTSELPYFINTQRFQPDETVRARVREQYEAEGRFVLVTVAYLIPEKGIDILLRAMPGLPASVVLWVVGDGPEATKLTALCAEYGLQARVRFLGLQRHVEPFLQAADCLVCPSLWEEAAGLVNLEAQACGLPVVASAIGGIPEYVADGDTGLLFPAGNADQLAERVRRLVEQPELHQRLCRQARARAVARFSSASRIQDFLDLYRG